MRTGLRLMALGVLFVAVVVWFFGGAHLGFSKTSVMVTTIDTITGLEAHSWEDRIVLGVDFLALAAGLSACCFGASWIFGRRSNRNSHQPPPS